MLITQHLKIWISSVSSDICKQPECAPVLCCRGEYHIEQRIAKERRQKLGIHIAFQGSESFAYLGGGVSFQQRGMLLPLQMAQGHCFTLSCKGKQTEVCI